MSLEPMPQSDGAAVWTLGDDCSTGEGDYAGIIATALDSACGYAAFSLMPADAAVLTVEFKTNLLAPAKGDRFLFRGRVVKPGRTLTVCDGQALALGDDSGIGWRRRARERLAHVCFLKDRSGTCHLALNLSLYINPQT